MSDAGGVKDKGTGIRVAITQSHMRTTAKTDFGTVLKKGASMTADAVVTAGALAAPFVPGGAIVHAAVTGVGALKSSVSGQAATMSGGGNATGLSYGGGQVVGGGGGAMPVSSGAGAGGVMGAIDSRAAGGDNQAQLMVATRQMQEMNMSFNLQYLMLQQKMQSDNRQFTLMSNIMKTKHETAKNAINNVR